MDYGRNLRCGAGRWCRAAKNDVIARWLRCAGGGGGLSQRKAGIRRFHVPQVIWTDRSDLHRQVRSERGRLRDRGMEELRARETESVSANARGRSHIRLRLASFREKSK